jgi:hypothetical protein
MTTTEFISFHFALCWCRRETSFLHFCSFPSLYRCWMLLEKWLVNWAYIHTIINLFCTFNNWHHNGNEIHLKNGKFQLLFFSPERWNDHLFYFSLSQWFFFSLKLKLSPMTYCDSMIWLATCYVYVCNSFVSLSLFSKPIL